MVDRTLTSNYYYYSPLEPLDWMHTEQILTRNSLATTKMANAFLRKQPRRALGLEMFRVKNAVIVTTQTSKICLSPPFSQTEPSEAVKTIKQKCE